MNIKEIGFSCIESAFKALKQLKGVKALNNDINVQTNADIVSNDAILDELRKSGIDANIYSEESKGMVKINKGDENLVFVIDPIDNTQLYLRGEIAFCSVAMIVLQGGKPTFSFVGDLATEDIYHCDEKFAYKNQEKILVPGSVQGRNSCWPGHRINSDLKDYTHLC